MKWQATDFKRLSQSTTITTYSYVPSVQDINNEFLANEQRRRTQLATDEAKAAAVIHKAEMEKVTRENYSAE